MTSRQISHIVALFGRIFQLHRRNISDRSAEPCWQSPSEFLLKFFRHFAEEGRCLNRSGFWKRGELFSGIADGLSIGNERLEKNVLASTQVGVYFEVPEGEIVNSGNSTLCDT